MTAIHSPQVSRRTFLKSTALTAGALAVAGAAGCTSADTSGTDEPEEQPAEQPEETPAEPEKESANAAEEQPAVALADEETYYNVCRGNCGGSCPLEGTVREGKLVRTQPMIFEGDARPFQQGCVKGQTNPLRLYATNRVTHPMKQAGERGSDNWEEITWDEALQLVADKFMAAQKDYGPSSVGFWLGAGNVYDCLNGNYTYFDNKNRVPNVGIAFERFLSKTGATVFSSSHDICQLYFQGTILLAPFNSIEDFQHSKLIVMWGANPADAVRQQWTYIVKAKDAGATLVTVDPQYTNSAAHSDIWVPIRPGTDSAMMLAMCNWIIDHDMVDEDYLRMKSVAPLLIKEDGMYLRLSDLDMDLEAGPEDAEGNLTAIDSPVVWCEESQAFVSMNAAAKPALTGVSDANGIAVRTVYDATLESIKPFDVAFAAEECGVPAEQIENLAELLATTKPGYIMNNWGMEHFYNSWRLYYALPLLASLTGNAQVSGAGYNSGFSSWASTHYAGPVAMNWEDLTIDDPQPNKVITGEYLYDIMKTGKWVGEDFPVRMVYIMTSNPLHSCMGVTYIKEALDAVDFVVVADSFMTDSAQYADLVLPIAMSWESEDFNGTWMRQKAVEPAGECWTDFDIFADLAKRMGYDDLYTKDAEGFLRTLIDTPENLDAGLGYDVWHEQGIVLGEYTYAEAVTPEYNALGRTQFYLEVVPPRDLMGQEFEAKDHLPYYEHAYEAYPGSPASEKYPFYGLSHHDNYHAQSLFAHNPWLDEFRGMDNEPYMRIHTSAAAERGIANGDVVRVFNDHGSVTLKAMLTEGIRPDTVLLPHGWQGDEFIDGHPQTLTAMCPDPVTSNNNLNDFMCQVEKA